VSQPALKHTPFHDFHVKRHARMVDYVGWEMPLLYKDTGIIAEHIHTRHAASIFDVSHMGRLRFAGKGATAFLQRMLTRNLEPASVGQSMYALVCNDQGKTLDDVIASRYPNDWLVVCNAGNREKLLAHFRSQLAGAATTLTDETFDTAMVAVQGPRAIELLDSLLPSPVGELKRYHFTVQRFMMMIQFTVFRSGYTGEDGAEIILGNKAAGLAMGFLLNNDDGSGLLKPAGLGARDTLRLEAGMPLYGHELTEDTDPLSAGLGWAVDLHKDFVGAAALRSVAERGPTQKLVGLELASPRAARQGYGVFAAGRPVGLVTSGGQSPTLGKSIAMAYVPAEYATPGTAVHVDLRGTTVDATVVKLPFYRRPK
jgi:aminomethyltransferase